MKQIDVNTQNSTYPVVIGADILNSLSDYILQSNIEIGTKILIITDDHVAPLYLDKITNVLNKFDVSSIVVKPGENAKSMSEVEMIIDYAIKQKLDRTSVIMALGGGVIGDLAGFVAAIYLRGISFIQIPTTILAHDSSVGGKVGINHKLGKNLIGAFYQPKLVFYDTAFLNSLPKRQIIAGLAEVIKHALIENKEFAYWLNNNSRNLVDLQPNDIIETLYRGILIKANIVKQDEKELGIRAYLNFGHTLAHVIETISSYQYLHGEAVAIGMVFASRLAHKLGLISTNEVAFIDKLIKKFDLPTTIPVEYDVNEMLEIMLRDKKFKQGRIRMVLPTEIGDVKIVDEIDKGLVRDVLIDMRI